MPADRERRGFSDLAPSTLGSEGEGMTDSEWLEQRGWRCIGKQRNGYGQTKYWDHLAHQPERRGAFTTTHAVQHQKQSERHGCDCIAVPMKGKE